MKLSKVLVVMAVTLLVNAVAFAEVAQTPVAEINQIKVEKQGSDQVHVNPVMEQTSTFESIFLDRVPAKIYIPKGIIIETELLTAVNSGKNKLGDIVQFRTRESLVINDVVVIPRGTVGEATVSKIRKAGSWGKGGKIDLTAKSVRTLNGVEVPLTLEANKSGGNANMAVGILALGVFSGFISGKNVDIPVGTRFNVAVESDTDLLVNEETLAEAMKMEEVKGVRVEIRN